MNRASLAAAGVLAGILTIVGAIGTWATYQGQSFAGTDANRGKTVAFAAGISLVLLAISAWRGWRWLAWVAALPAILAFAFSIWSLSSIGKFIGAPSGASVGKGWGIWVATIGSAVLLVSCVVTALARYAVERRAEEPPAATPAP